MSSPKTPIPGQAQRLARGGLIDRQQIRAFRFDGKSYRGYAGDTLASALMASGVRLVARSFKYHRPRGILTAGSEEPNALVELRGGARREPNTRATVIELFDGLEAHSQNRWPSLAFDVGALSSVFAPIFVAGFYYKTFMWPAALWEKLYEPAIRRAAGLGRASHEPDPDAYEKSHAFCDVLVIGAGASGLMAAVSAGRSGARVILCEEDFLLGGRLNGESHEIEGMSGSAWAREIAGELEALPNVRILRRTTVFGAYDGSTYGAVERVSDHLPVPLPGQPRQRLWKIVTKRTVLAAGAIERPLIFSGNDKPGVMMASAMRTYVNRYGVAPGGRVALFTCTDSGWHTAFELARAAVAVEAIVDVRRDARRDLMDTAHGLGLRVLSGAHVVAAHGGSSLNELTVADRNGRAISIRADALGMSGGWNPSLSLSTHLGGRPRWSESLCAFVPGDLPRAMTVVGHARGTFLLSEALREGQAAGAEAALSTGHRTKPTTAPRAEAEEIGASMLWLPANSRGKAFVDFQNDVTSDDIALAAREGFRSVELLKRYTTLGMATDQGRLSNVNGLAMLAAVTSRGISSVGTTTSRPPYTPVAIGALAGPHRGREFRPTRLTASHEWAQERGAKFTEAGQWLRAQWFPAPGETDWLQSVVREVTGVRSSVGVCDVSTLGKIDVQGTDAAAFLDRIYANTFSTLPPGKVRYGLMLREDGLVFDDGTVAHLAPGHYVLSTTTANAARVMQHLEHARQVIWPDLDVQIASVTEQWAQYAVAGPRSREVLTRLFDDALDVSNVSLPYMGCATFQWRGIPARLFRVSFSGELAYELAVPAAHGDAVIRSIMHAGAELGITPYGTEALGVMRIEKGHVAGNELNGTTTAADLGLGRLMSTRKDFIGRILAARPGLTAPDRPSLVGIKPVSPAARLASGAHFLERGASASLENDQGYVTSVAFSPTVGHWIGLGLLKGGARRLGERIRAADLLRGADVEVDVCSPVFVDVDGVRLRS